MRRIHEPKRIARLKRDAHKGDRGRVLAVGGSLAMSGAIRLTGWGALRGGAGLVTIACPDVVQPIVAGELPCAMTLPLPSRRGSLTVAGAAPARAAAEGMDAVVVGPGLDRGPRTFLKKFLHGLETPLVIDADALNIVAGDESVLAGHRGPRVVTPHPGEAERLLGESIPSRREGRVRAASQLVEKLRATVVLKGSGTVVCDGDDYYVCPLGNPGMATGGTGDVLAGVLAARLGRGVDPFVAAVQAVHVHARAGDLAAAAVGETGMIATDLVANLALALDELTQRPSPRAKSAAGTGARANKAKTKRTKGSKSPRSRRNPRE